jgi:hypothetical protein
MKSRGARYVVLASLTVQLLVAMAMGGPLGLSPRTHRAEKVVSPASEGSKQTTKGLPADRVLFSDRIDRNNNLLSGQASNSILLTGRNAVTKSSLDLPRLNTFISRERFTSNWSAFVVGHLIKNAFHQDVPPQTSATK